MTIVRPPDLGETAWQNRRLIEIGAATDAEMAAVIREFEIRGAVRGVIDCWHLIAVRDHSVKIVTLHVLGHHQAARRWMTSAVMAMSPDRRFAKTQNSVYCLGVPATDGPSAETLLRVVVAGLAIDGREGQYEVEFIPGGLVGHA